MLGYFPAADCALESVEQQDHSDHGMKNNPISQAAGMLRRRFARFDSTWLAALPTRMKTTRYHQLFILTLLALIATVGSAPAGLVHQWTFNDGTANDSVGTNHGTLYNGATVSGGQLHLDGVNDYFRTSPLAQTLSNRTLMVWVTLSNLTQQAGSALTLENPTGNDVFDGIIYGEQVTNRWINGSDNALRWDFSGGTEASPVETSLAKVWIAIVYGDPASGADNIKIYRNGVLAADYNPGNPLITYPAGVADVVIGVRHSDLVGGSGTPEGFDEFLAGSINEARIYDTALTASQIAEVSNGQIVLDNPGFESPALGVGGYTYNLLGWTDIASGSQTNARFVERISGFAAEGNQHLGMAPGWSVWQDPGATYQANTVYRLRVAVGNRPGWTVAGNLSTFTLTDPTETATRSGAFDASTIPTNTFVETQLALDTTTTPALVGKPIRIKLTAGGNSRSHFDNVRLDTQVQRVSVDGSSTWLGFMNVLDLPGDGGAYLFGQPWATADLRAVFDAPLLLTLTPNTSIDRDSPNDPYWWKAPGNNPNKNLGAVMYVEDDSLAGSTVYFSGFTVSNSLVAPYTCIAFIRDFVPDYSTFTEVTTPLVSGSIFSLIKSTTPGNHIQYGFHTTGPNARLATAPSLGRVQVSSLGAYFPVVTNPNDSGPGSLRQTIADAVSGATITFARSLCGQTITLTSGQLLISNKNLTIDASTLARGIAVDGNANNRLFNVVSGNSLELVSVTLKNGLAPGGGSGNGGAILINANSSTLLDRCTLSGNTAGTGGAVYCLSGSTLTMRQCTLTGNAAINAGAVGSFGAVALVHCTVIGNSASVSGGGIYNLGTLALTNSIVAANTPNNFAGNAFTSVNNLTSGNPMLGALGYYGGSAPTMLPLPGSPAIDAGMNTGNLPATDQRGFARVVGSALDLGAVETGNVIPGYAAVVTVNTDTFNGLDNDEVSLREAVILSASGATVTFAPALSAQTILLTNGQLTVTKNLTIDASALPDGIILDGNANGRVFEVATNATVWLDSLTITNGNAIDFGGGIRSHGVLTLNRCTLVGNHATFGGGAFNDNDGNRVLVVTNCLVLNNTAVDGAGIYNYAGSLLWVWNSTFTGNSSTDGAGGAIRGYFGTVVGVNCTIVGNSASGPGGGIYSYEGEATFTNSIIAANFAGSLTNIAGPFSGIYNLTNGSPLLAPLGNYGGPTQTMPPLPGSPAIDAGLASGNLPATDQRGLPRVVGPAPDIGAVESQTVEFFYNPVLSTADSGPYTLRAAIAGATAGETITFGSAVSGQTILLTSGQLTLGKNLTIDASTLPAGITIDGNQASRIFEVNAGTTNVLLNLTLTGGNGAGATFNGHGGAIFNGGTLTLSNCVLRGNEVPSGGAGGGLFTTGAGSAATVVGCVFSTNRTIGGSNGGGGIYADNSTLYCSDSIFRGNISSNTAGAVHVISGGTGTLAGCTFEGNVAPGGGAVRSTSATLMLSNCVFTGNVATSDGGAIWDQGTTVVNRCIFIRNAATNFGGGILSLGYTAVSECSLVANAGGNGGGLCSYGTVTVSGCTMVSNTVTVYGGGIFNGGDMTISQSTFTGNFTAGHGGGIYSQSTLVVNQSTVVSNSTAGVGGGILILGGTTVLTNTIVAGNSATSSTNIFGSLTGANNLTSGNPLLAALGNYGGPTLTMPPLAGSPAIDAGNDAAASSFASDQRGGGYLRVSGDHVDIGAVELQLITSSTAVEITAPGSPGNGPFQFSFANDSGASFRVLATTNVTLPASNWTFLGFAAETPPGSGQFQFTDPGATNHPQRYYRVKSP